MSDYLETQLIQHIFRSATYTKPTILAVALCTVTPTDSTTGGLVGFEVNAAGYARQTLNPLDANWTAAASGNGTTTNVPTVNFPPANADWGTVVAAAIVDNTTFGSGNLLFYGSLSNSKFVTIGDTFNFVGGGGLKIQIDN